MKITKKGFTLIELLIVIAIIGVLAVAFLPSVLGAPSKGRDTQRIAQVQKLQQLFTAQSVAGDADFAVLDDGCIASNGVDKTVGKYVKDHLPDFGGVYPSDPQPTQTITDAAKACANGQYGFERYKQNGSNYTAAVYARVENDSNANILCKNIDADVEPTLNIPFVEADKAKAKCFIALIQ